MNILFIEDERDLAAVGIAQLELKGYTVFPAYDIAEAQAVLDDIERPVDCILADHRLPDGRGIEFVIDTKKSFPKCICAIISGCLTRKDVETLKALRIPYYSKPLLYSEVMDDLRQRPAPAEDEETEVQGLGTVEEEKEDVASKLWPHT